MSFSSSTVKSPADLPSSVTTSVRRFAEPSASTLIPLATTREGPEIVPDCPPLLRCTNRTLLTAVIAPVRFRSPALDVSVMSSRVESTRASSTLTELLTLRPSAAIAIFPRAAESGAVTLKFPPAVIVRSPHVARADVNPIFPPAESEMPRPDAATASKVISFCSLIVRS